MGRGVAAVMAFTPSPHAATRSLRREVVLNIDPYQYNDGLPTPLGGGNAGITDGNWTLLLGSVGPPDVWSPDDATLNSVGWRGGEGSRDIRDANIRSTVAPGPMWPLRNTSVMLFNNAADPGQHMNVAPQNPDIVAALWSRLNWWATEVAVEPQYATLGCFGGCTDPRGNPANFDGASVPWLP